MQRELLLLICFRKARLIVTRDLDCTNTLLQWGKTEDAVTIQSFFYKNKQIAVHVTCTKFHAGLLGVKMKKKYSRVV